MAVLTIEMNVLIPFTFINYIINAGLQYIIIKSLNCI